MPYLIRKLPNKDLYKVYNENTNKVYSYSTTLDNAKKQVALLKSKELEPKVALLEGGSAPEGYLQPFFIRIGSKTSLIDDILPIIPSHSTYVEPFLGGAAIFWNKVPAKKSVINDIDSDLIEGYRLLKKVPLNSKLDYIDDKSLKERQDFIDKVDNNSSIADRLIKRFLMTNTTFNSIGKGKLYKIRNIKSRMDRLKEYKDILKPTTILNTDYLKVIKKYDSPDTFFFLDPPYEESKSLYKNDTIDYNILNEELKKLKGKFLLTLNDSKEIEKIFKDFNQKRVIVNTGNNAIFNTKNRRELFITNYDLEKVGGSIETDNFYNNGVVSLPEFKSVKINLPTYMYKRLPDIQGKPPPYRYKLVIPITSSRNISSRKKDKSVVINQKPVANPIVNIEQSNNQPTLDEFSPADRDKINAYYDKVVANENNNIDEINKDEYVIKQRGKPLPCGNAKPKETKEKQKVVSEQIKNIEKKVDEDIDKLKRRILNNNELSSLSEYRANKYVKKRFRNEVIPYYERDIDTLSKEDRRIANKIINPKIKQGIEDLTKLLSKESVNKRIEETKVGIDKKEEPISLLDQLMNLDKEKKGTGLIDSPELYEKAKKLADEKYKKPSAYKSGFIIKKYKELGGTYSGKKPETTGIARWFKEEWTDIGNKEYPVFRPTKRITKETPLTVEEIKPSNLKKQIALKQEIKGNNNLPPFEEKTGGKVSENKILSNNNMPNSWISYVKEYASKNGMSYRDALRDPKCKAGYKPKSRKVVSGAGVIDESEFADQSLIADAYNESQLGANAGKKYISL